MAWRWVNDIPLDLLGDVGIILVVVAGLLAAGRYLLGTPLVEAVPAGLTPEPLEQQLPAAITEGYREKCLSCLERKERESLAYFESSALT